MNKDTDSMFGETGCSDLNENFHLSLDLVSLTGSFSNDDGDAKENGKKVIGLDWKNNNFARSSPFFEHFFAVAARLQRESASFHVLSRT